MGLRVFETSLKALHFGNQGAITKQYHDAISITQYKPQNQCYYEVKTTEIDHYGTATFQGS